MRIIETVEVDLRTLEVVQSHGMHNQIPSTTSAL